MNDPEILTIPPTAPPMDTAKQSQFFLTRTKSKVLSSREKEQLKKQGFPLGFAQSIAANNAVFPLRIWIVDNSGSMNASDGCRYISKKRNELKISECTRWKEIQEVVLYHAQLAGLLESSTVFRVSLFIIVSISMIPISMSQLTSSIFKTDVKYPTCKCRTSNFQHRPKRASKHSIRCTQRNEYN